MLVLFHVWRPRGHSCRILVLSTHILFPFNTTWTPILERRRVFIIFTSKPLTGEVQFLFWSPDEAIQRMSQSSHTDWQWSPFFPMEPIFIQKVAYFLLLECWNIKVCSICVFAEAGLAGMNNESISWELHYWMASPSDHPIYWCMTRKRKNSQDILYILPTWYSDSRFLTKVTFHPQLDMISNVFSSYTLIFRKLILDPQSMWGPQRTIKWVASEGIKL